MGQLSHKAEPSPGFYAHALEPLRLSLKQRQKQSRRLIQFHQHRRTFFFTRDSTAALTAQLGPQDSTHDCDARLATGGL